MLKTTGLSIVSVSKVDDNTFVGDGGGAEAENSRSVGGLDASRKNLIKPKSRTKSGLNHMEYLKNKKDVHPSRGPQKASLIAKETLTKGSVKYTDFADMFSLDLAFELPEHTGINDHAIELVDANELIRPSKSFAGTPIFSHLF